MQRFYVDFGRGMSEPVDIGYEGDGELTTVTLQDGERVILYDSSLEVEAVARYDASEGRVFWFGVPDWSTQIDYDTTG